MAALLQAALLPAVAQVQTLRLTPLLNTRSEQTGRVWASGRWGAFAVEERSQDLNGDADTDDCVLALVDLQTMTVIPTGLAFDFALVDHEREKPIAFGKELVAIRISEDGQGQKDLNRDGQVGGDCLVLFDPRLRQATPLGLDGVGAVFVGDSLLFARDEGVARRDLNGDKDLRDFVLCRYDLKTRQVENLGVEAANGIAAAGDDWIAAMTSEAAQGSQDLNGDGDRADLVAQLYQFSTRTWVNTRLDCSNGMVLTSRLLALAVDEAKQGSQDRNADGDTKDVICVIRNLVSGEVFDTGQDCDSGLAAEEGLVGMVTREEAQGNRDLNGDGDTKDDALQIWSLETGKLRNVGRDASGGIVVTGGKVLLACSEESQGRADLSRDRDTDDNVLLLYDPVQNRIGNLGIAIDGAPAGAEGRAVWRVSESDQGDRDLNRDGDTLDIVAFALDVTRGTFGSTGMAADPNLAVCSLGALFACPEPDQGETDLNGDGDREDTVVQVGRFPARPAAAASP